MTAPDTSTEAVTALLEGVTPGHWVTDEESEGHGWGVSWRIVQSGNWLNDIAEMVNEQDARFIAAARELVPALAAERDRLAAQVVQLQRDLDAANVRAVKVKPLEWDGGDPSNCAQTPVGEYVVQDDEDDGWGLYTPSELDGDHAHSYHKTEHAAKAAAQADYEARIMSAIKEART